MLPRLRSISAIPIQWLRRLRNEWRLSERTAGSSPSYRTVRNDKFEWGLWEAKMEYSIDHLGIAVKSLAAAKSIYEKLGLSVSAEETVEQEQVRVVMIPMGQSRLELLEATSDSSTVAKFIAKRGEGLHHVCLRV